MDNEARVMEKVRAVRSSIDAAIQRSSGGPLAPVLGDPGCGDALVVKILDVHPCMGKVAGRRVLRELGVPERTLLSRLDHPRRDALAARCRCTDV